MVSLADLLADGKRIEVAVGAHRIGVTYRVHCVTDALLLTRAGEAEHTIMQRLFLGIELAGADGEQIELTEAGVAQIPASVRSAIYEAVFEDVYPNETRESSSGSP